MTAPDDNRWVLDWLTGADVPEPRPDLITADRIAAAKARWEAMPKEERLARLEKIIKSQICKLIERGK